MVETYEFLRSILDTVTENIVVIDNEGNILFVNHGWRAFGLNNDGTGEDDQWQGVNYLKECNKAADLGDDFGIAAAEGIAAVLSGEKDTFYFEYPCHTPDEKRWFMMRVTPLTVEGSNCFVVSHQNITERKLAEEEVQKLARIDGLTGIPNRRYFDEFIENEWRRCARVGMPVSLAIIDLDYFKLLNDTYGHQAGDECLKMVANTVSKVANRPSDMCARYGGEEFAVVYGSTTLEQAQYLMGKLVQEINALNIANEQSPIMPVLTVSVGLSVAYPNKTNGVSDLIKAADELLCSAKNKGRNRIVHDY